MQFLSGLCNVSVQSINKSVNQLLTTFFVSAQLIQQTTFQEQTKSLIDQAYANAYKTLAHRLSVLRTTNHGNAIITTFGTNFEYIAPWFYRNTPSAAITQPLAYDNGCSCGLSINCTTQAGFVETNSSRMRPIRGLKMGCTPSESFLASTLECFYDISCVSLIQEQMINTTNDFEPLLAKDSRFAINTTVLELVHNLFTENWTTTADYARYYDLCAPKFCAYPYIQKLNPLNTITVFLGLYGGLTFILGWICPNIMNVLLSIYWNRKKRNHPVGPVAIVAMETMNQIHTTPNPADAIDTPPYNILHST